MNIWKIRIKYVNHRNKQHFNYVATNKCQSTKSVCLLIKCVCERSALYLTDWNCLSVMRMRMLFHTVSQRSCHNIIKCGDKFLYIFAYFGHLWKYTNNCPNTSLINSQLKQLHYADKIFSKYLTTSFFCNPWIILLTGERS